MSEVEKRTNYWGGRLFNLLCEYAYEKPIITFSVVVDSENTVDISLLEAPNVSSLSKFLPPKELKDTVLIALAKSIS